MTDYNHYAGFRIVEDKKIAPTKACFCVGPQNGEPLCPCAMKNVRIENGRYVEKRDLGPAKISCLHNQCQQCGGTGPKKSDGSYCVHMISCPCPRCSHD